VKTWIFVLTQSVIAATGISAWMSIGDVRIAGVAAAAVTALGIVRLFLARRKSAQRGVWADGQQMKTLPIVDRHVECSVRQPTDEPVAEMIAPPMPHRPTVAAFLELAGLGDPDDQLERYDELVAMIERADDDCADEAASFCEELTGNVLGVTLEGLAALALGRQDDALKYFREATLLHSGWALPWLGWATVCHANGNFVELATRHPLTTGVELRPYDCGDEDVFVELKEADRPGLASLFEQTVAALKRYHNTAENQRSAA